RDKHSESGADERHLFGASEMQGWRINMEDAHTLLLKLEGGKNAFFGVYDGHGGSSAAKFSGEHVPKRLAEEEAYKAQDYKLALKKAFLGTDEDLRSDSNFFRDPSGCTAVVALITEDEKIFVANAGDSRSVLGVKGEAKPLSFDHKPQNEVEKKVGYETPKELPQLYSASRVAAAKERWTSPGRNQFTRPGPSGLSNLARVFGTNIMFHPSGGISSNGVLDQDDSSEEYESEEGEHETGAKGSSLQAPPSKDPNRALREQLEKLKEDGEGDEEGATKVGSEKKWTIDEDGDSQMEDQSGAESTPTITKSTIFNRRIGGKNSQQNPDTTSKDEFEIDSPVEPTKLPVGLSAAPPVSIGKPLIRSPPAISTPETKPKELQGEAPPPPKVNGVVKHEPAEQTKPEPTGDELLNKATKGDGLLDKSEGPALVKSE
ncbi:Protein phosphatase 2C 2, partial [Tulasnella sp. 408]